MPELEIRGNDITCTRQTAPHSALFPYIKDIVNYSAMSTFHLLKVEFCDCDFSCNRCSPLDEICGYWSVYMSATLNYGMYILLGNYCKILPDAAFCIT